MATLPLTAHPANPRDAIGALRTVMERVFAPPAPANDTEPCWTADPAAAALLVRCAKNPPAGNFHRSRFGRIRREHWRYRGYRVNALERIRDEHARRTLEQCHATGDYAPFRALCDQPSVVDAIDAAVSGWRA